jgi:hypothetical protein
MLLIMCACVVYRMMNGVQPTLSRMKTVRVGLEAEACWSGCHCAWKVAMSFFWKGAIAGTLGTFEAWQQIKARSRRRHWAMGDERWAMGRQRVRGTEGV